MINLGNSVNIFSKENTEPSFRGNLEEGVTTMAEVLGKIEAGWQGEKLAIAPSGPKKAG